LSVGVHDFVELEPVPFGPAVLATLSTTRTSHLLAQGHSQASALVGGYHLAFWIAAGLVVAAIVVALTVLQPEERAEAEVATEAPQTGAEQVYSEVA
jgi:hypothetical protein